jgi:hypothetical protein
MKRYSLIKDLRPGQVAIHTGARQNGPYVYPTKTQAIDRGVRFRHVGGYQLVVDGLTSKYKEVIFGANDIVEV